MGPRLREKRSELLCDPRHGGRDVKRTVDSAEPGHAPAWQHADAANSEAAEYADGQPLPLGNRL